MRIYKYISLLVVSFAMFIQASNYACILLDYLMHKEDYIANCENINKPLLQCNGQCQMGKQMKMIQEETKQMNIIVSFFAINNHQFNLRIETPLNPIEAYSSNFPILSSIGQLRSFLNFIFQPPD